MKEITIQVPDGKSAEWKNGVLTLVDEPKADNRPITERVKTFEDALKELGRRAEAGDETAGNLLADYETNVANILDDTTKAYMRLAVITYALNEGWEAQFTEDEYRYFPWFYLYTQEEYDNMDEDKKRRCVLRSGGNTSASHGFVYVVAYNDASNSYTYSGSRLVFKSSALARYAGEQFTEEWADFLFKPRTSESQEPRNIQL